MLPRYDAYAMLWLTIILLSPIWAVISESMLLTQAQLGKLGAKYGQQGYVRLVSWQRLINKHRNSPTGIKLKEVNRFFNQLEFIDDKKMWGKRDYWATPVEFLGKGGGDCEDFSIAKYFTLRELNMPQQSLRLTYVKTKRLNQAHMVVSYYPKPDAEPLILDNIDKKIKKARQRTDLIPAYSFNGDNLWKAKSLAGYGTVVGKTSDISIWRQLLRKIKRIRDN